MPFIVLFQVMPDAGQQITRELKQEKKEAFREKAEKRKQRKRRKGIGDMQFCNFSLIIKSPLTFRKVGYLY